MSNFTGKFADPKGNAKCFDRDTSVCKPSRNAGAKPSYPDYSGGLTGKTNIDSDLEYSGGNSGYKGGEK
jgi:hypothetical protein